MKVVLNILTHGDETVGVGVAKAIKKNKIERGELIINIANELAYKNKKRFIDEDLNRAFPGKHKGNHEQMLAYKIVPLIKSADIVIDIHSTRSGLKDALIVTKLNNKTSEYIHIINPKYLLLMSATKKNALISNAKVGIAFEYGHNKDKIAQQNIIHDIEKLLSYVGLISKKFKKIKKRTMWLDVYKEVPKIKKAKLLSSVRNYKLIKKDSVYAVTAQEKIKAVEDFYPILFGKNSYKTIFGFAAKPLKVDVSKFSK